VNYELAYRIGFHPWEDAADQPAFTQALSELLDREEQGREPPLRSRASTSAAAAGIWGSSSRERGWQVHGRGSARSPLTNATVLLLAWATQAQGDRWPRGASRGGWIEAAFPGWNGGRRGVDRLPGAEAGRAVFDAGPTSTGTGCGASGGPAPPTRPPHRDPRAKWLGLWTAGRATATCRPRRSASWPSGARWASWSPPRRSVVVANLIEDRQ